MPSSATITAFYNFTANTKARASHVQTNFDTFRGHLLPVHPSTATSSDNTYNIGAQDYRWNTIYLGNKVQFGNTTTNYCEITKDVNTTTGEVAFKANSTEVFRFGSFGNTGRRIQTDMTSSVDLYGIAVINSAAHPGHTKTATAIVGSTMTIWLSGKRPIEVSFNYYASYLVQATTTAGTATAQMVFQIFEGSVGASSVIASKAVSFKFYNTATSAYNNYIYDEGSFSKVLWITSLAGSPGQKIFWAAGYMAELQATISAYNFENGSFSTIRIKEL